MAGIPREVLREDYIGKKSAAYYMLLTNIQSWFEAGERDKAYKGIAELEALGFRSEAIKVLATAEKAMGNLLNELESLFMLTKGMVVDMTNLEYFFRITELLVKVQEPELASGFLERLATLVPGRQDVKDRIDALRPTCLPLDGKSLAYKGVATATAITVEIRKYGIVNRNFEQPLSVHSIDWGKIATSIPLEELGKLIVNKIPELVMSTNVTTMVFRSPRGAESVDMLVLTPPFEELRGFACWVDISIRLNEKMLTTHKSLDTGRCTGQADWNERVLTRAKELLDSKLAEEWFDKVSHGVLRLLSAVTTGNNQDDDVMFS